MRVIVAIIIGAVLIILGLGIYEEIQWNKWAREHCKKIGEVSSSVGFGFGSDGNTTTVIIPGKTGYQCDDGKTYWK